MNDYLENKVKDIVKAKGIPDGDIMKLNYTIPYSGNLPNVIYPKTVDRFKKHVLGLDFY